MKTKAVTTVPKHIEVVQGYESWRGTLVNALKNPTKTRQLSFGQEARCATLNRDEESDALCVTLTACSVVGKRSMAQT